MKECRPFAHKLTYVTDREDCILCKRCWRQWDLLPNERPFESARMGFDELHALRKKYD